MNKLLPPYLLQRQYALTIILFPISILLAFYSRLILFPSCYLVNKKKLTISLVTLLSVSCGGEQLTTLMQATKNGDTYSVIELIDKGANVNETSKFGKTAMMIAATGGSTDILKLLIRSGAEVNAQDLNGTTPLLIASTTNHADIVEVLLANKADVNVTDTSGNSALVNATFFGYIDCITAILKYKSLVSDSIIKEAFLLAAGLGNIKIVKVMLASGIDINTKGYENRTALMVAAHYGKKDVIDLLLNSNAATKFRDSHGYDVIDIATQAHHNEIVALIEKTKTNKNPL